MTVTDRTAATEQEFRDRIAAFETAPTPPEVREAAVIEEVARAIYDEEISTHTVGWPWDQIGSLTHDRYRRLAAAAVAAYRATQDGGAEEAVRRVEALAKELDSKSPQASAWHVANRIRAALAPRTTR